MLLLSYIGRFQYSLYDGSGAALYIHGTSCISAQQTFSEIDIESLIETNSEILLAREPEYVGIPSSTLRRMGKAVRLGVGAAMPLINDIVRLDGIIIGTANGGMEDCIKFLDQVIQYNEGTLTPTNFVQSSVNAIASQIAFINANKGYNITHVSRGLAFENALLDAVMLLKEQPGNTYLLGGVEEQSSYQYNVDKLAASYKDKPISNAALYKNMSKGSIAGEGAAMFIVNAAKNGATAKLLDLKMLHTYDKATVASTLNEILSENQDIDLYISGENGDERLRDYYESCERNLDEEIILARFKHMTGEFPVATALALWLSCHIIKTQQLPSHMIKRKAAKRAYNKILIYNNFHGLQHSFILISKL